jgi:hypothetical protein
MMRKILYTVSFAAVILLGMAARAQLIHVQDAGQQSKQSDEVHLWQNNLHRQFRHILRPAVEGSSKETMGFVVNNNTQVQVEVKVRTLVAVEYPTNR